MQIGRRTNAPAHGVGGHPRLVQRDVALGGGAHAGLGSIGVAVIPSVVVGTGLVGTRKPPGVIGSTEPAPPRVQAQQWWAGRRCLLYATAGRAG
jgi:hypothetical protein